jgi:hypothetical protein
MVQTIAKGAVLRVGHAYHWSERDGSQEDKGVHVSTIFLKRRAGAGGSCSRNPFGQSPNTNSMV